MFRRMSGLDRMAGLIRIKAPRSQPARDRLRDGLVAAAVPDPAWCTRPRRTRSADGSDSRTADRTVAARCLRSPAGDRVLIDLREYCQAGQVCRDAADRRRSVRTGARSTTRPAYITATSSAISATIPRSCVIRMIAMPVCCCSSRSRSRICACTVTSSAVVGSSAISRSGAQASAMAIITRWRMPPDIWCGYSSKRRSGAGMRTRCSAAIARLAQSARRRQSGRARASPR